MYVVDETYSMNTLIQLTHVFMKYSDTDYNLYFLSMRSNNGIHVSVHHA